MAFWSGETLAKTLGGLIKPFDPSKIDCAAYTLALGPEVYVTSDQRLGGSAETGVKVELDPGSQFRIPPGQFAFLLTEEEITVPDTAIALISIRASYKFKGLVNVSGFHVDPGWQGRLIFSVYNAGPASVVLSRGAPVFLIWYIGLDQATKLVRKDGKPKFNQLPDALLNNMGGNVFSPMVLSQEVTELRQSNADLREEQIERANNLRIELAELKSDWEFHKRFFWTVVVGAIVFAVARPFLGGLLSNGHLETGPKIAPSESQRQQPAASKPDRDKDRKAKAEDKKQVQN